MSARESFCHYFQIQPNNFSKNEQEFIEAEIFFGIYSQLLELYRKRYKQYFQLLNFTIEMENDMLETNFIQIAINDILSTNEYNIQGIAEYTGIPEEIICEFAAGINKRPQASTLIRIIELHKQVKREAYREIILKLLKMYLNIFKDDLKY